MTLAIVIPFKSLSEGKSRLATVLEPALRARLCRYMLERTVALAAGLGPITVVSDDPRVAALLADGRHEARLLLARPARDLNLALHQARGEITPGVPMLVLPTDLVLLERATLDDFLRQPDRLCIAPDRDRLGTNLLYLPSPAVAHFQFGFGPDSLLFHTLEAGRLGYQASYFEAAQASLDLDTPADLIAACRLGNVDIAALLRAPVGVHDTPHLTSMYRTLITNNI